MAAEISNHLTTSAEVNLTTTAALAGAPPAVPALHGEENCGNGESIVSVDVPAGGGGGDDEGDFDRFDDLELGAEDGAVPLGDILDKFEAASNGLVAAGEGEAEAVPSIADTAISATVNVSTLDLSDPESIHRHLSQLNDTVLKVSTACIRLNNDDGNSSSNGLSSSDDPHIQASTSSPSSSSCSLDPQKPPPPTTSSPSTPHPSSACAFSPKPLPPPPLETLPSGTRSIRTLFFPKLFRHLVRL